MKHDVHLYCVVRVKIPNVEAPSQIEAIEKAERNYGPCLHKVLYSYKPIYSGMETKIETAYAEEIVGALVDEVGDLDFSRSRNYENHYISDASGNEWFRKE